MVAPQPPSVQVLIPAQSMPRADVPSQRLAPVAAIEADHIIMMNGSPHRYSRDTNFVGLNRRCKLTQRMVHGSDEIRKLICPQLMMSHVTRDDFGGQIWVVLYGIHDALCSQFYREVCMFEGSLL